MVSEKQKGTESESNDFRLGWEEWVELEDLGIPAILAKVDTGAKTSSLHASNIERYGHKRPRVRFSVFPFPERQDVEIVCKADVIDERRITSSNGQTELRPIIQTRIQLGGKSWEIEVSLTNREGMSRHMLLGRGGLPEGARIEPTESCVHGASKEHAADYSPSRGKEEKFLKIAILSREPKSYSTRRLVEAAEARDHLVDVIDPLRCYLSISAESPEIHYEGKKLRHYDAIIPRVGASITFYGMAVVRQFRLMGTLCLNSAESIGKSRDKLYAHQLLAEHGIQMPTTGMAHSPKDIKSLLSITGGAPVVLKLLQGAQGQGVVLAETNAAATSVIGAVRNLKAHMLVQEYVREAAGTDIRCLVVGSRVVAGMERRAAKGEFRANLHQGGSARKTKLTAEERKLALQATKAMGLGVAGVDFLRTDDGPKVLEVNSSPGLQGVEQSSGLDIAGTIIDHTEKLVLRGKRKR